MAESSNTTTTETKGRLAFIKNHPRRTILLVAILLVAGIGGLVYSIQAQQAAAAASKNTPQTATVRQGNLIISTSGTGTLTASNEEDLAFTTGGQVTGVFVKPGDHVEKGTLLAQIDDQSAQTKYIEAKQAYDALTSADAIATAQQQVAQAQKNLMTAKYDLEYLISPEVMYWETEIAKGEQNLKDAGSQAELYPSDQNAQQALQKAKDFLSFAQDKLTEAWQQYYTDYVPKTFRLLIDGNNKDIYDVPTDLQIQVARTAIDEAQKKLDDAQAYYNVLTGSPMPENPSSDALVQLQQTKQDLQDAQDNLDGTKIIAPISGTILSVGNSVGNTVDTSTFITMADLSQLEVDFYIDSTDWDQVAVGNQVEITFDNLPDQTFTGKVTELDTEISQSNNSSVVNGIANLDSTFKDSQLPIGASASLTIIHAQANNVVLVPVGALHEATPGSYTVYLDENGTFTQRAVEIGLQDDVYAEVKSGLQAGDVVSTGPITTN